MSVRQAISNLTSRIKTAITRFEQRLDADWRTSWRWGSTIQHTVATGAVIDYISNNPNALNALLSGLPARWRFDVFLTLAGVWFVAGWAIRVYRGKSNA